jgi:hypothetical protein
VVVHHSADELPAGIGARRQTCFAGAKVLFGMAKEMSAGGSHHSSRRAAGVRDGARFWDGF